jgi:hypothetical protein
MTERLSKSGEYVNEEDKFATERAVLKFFDLLRAQGTNLSETRFETLEAARDEGLKFAETINEIADKIGDISEIIFRVTGKDVERSNVEFNRIDGKIVGISVNIETPFVNEPFKELQGYHWGTPLIPGEDDNGHFITPYLVLQDSRSSKLNTAENMPVAKLFAQSYIKAPITTDTFIDIPAVTTHDTRNRAIAQVVLKNFAPENTVRQALASLLKEIEGEDESNFTSLINIEALRTIAATKSEDADIESVVDAVREIFGHERPLIIKGMAHEGASGNQIDRYGLTGKLIDVLPSFEKLQINEPLFVLESLQRDDEGIAIGPTQLYYIPLSNVETLEF